MRSDVRYKNASCNSEGATIREAASRELNKSHNAVAHGDIGEEAVIPCAIFESKLLRPATKSEFALNIARPESCRSP